MPPLGRRALAVAAVSFCSSPVAASPARDAQVAAPRAGTRAPRIDIGDTRFQHGQKVDSVSVCSPDRAVSREWGPRIYDWHLPDGKLTGTIGELRSDILQSVTCRGDLTLEARGDQVVLWRGGRAIARATIKDAVGTAIDGEAAHVLAGDGKVFAVDRTGAKVSWTAPAPIAVKFVFRADRVVSVEAKTLTWSSPRRSRQVTLPRPISAIGEVGDDVAIVDDAGDVRVLTGPTLSRPVWRIDPSAVGQARTVGGDSAWIAVGTEQGFLVQARRKASKPMAPLQVVPQTMYRAINAVAVDGDSWLVGGDDYRIHRVRRGATRYELKTTGHKEHVWAVAFDGRWLASGGSDGVRVHTPDRSVDRVLHPEVGLGTRPILAIGLTRSSLWALDDYHTLFRWKRSGLSARKPIASIEAVAALDTRRLVVWSGGKLRVLDPDSGKLGAGVAVDPSPTEPALAAGKDLVAVFDDLHGDRPIQLVDIDTGKPLGRIDREDGSTTASVAVSPDGQWVAVALDERLLLWSRRDRSVRELGRHPAPISSLAFAADGRLAAGDWFGHIRVWERDNPAPQRELTNHRGSVNGLAWSGRSLASGGSDYRVQLTDVPE